MIIGRAIASTEVALLVCLVLVGPTATAGAPQTAQERLDLGQELLAQGQAAEALAEFEKVLEAAPQSASAFYYAGAALGRLQRFDEALEYLVQSAELDPGNGAAHQMACIAAYQGGRHAEAWEQAILAAQAGVAMGQVFTQLDTVMPRPDDLETRLGVPRIFIQEIDTAALAARALRPGDEDTSSTDASLAVAWMPEVRRQFGLGLLQSPSLAVVNRPDLASYVMEIRVDSVDGVSLDGFIRIVDSEGEGRYTRRVSISDVTSAASVRNEVSVVTSNIASSLEAGR